MKKALVFILLFAAGCTVAKKAKKQSLERFSVEHNVVYYDKKPFAELQAMTWSLDGGELVREMNFKLLDKNKERQVIGDMIDFLSDRHPNDEIEIEFDVEKGSDEWKL